MGAPGVIAGLLWSGYPERSARHNLSSAIFYLRKATGEEAFAAAWGVGEALSLDDAAALAVEESVDSREA